MFGETSIVAGVPDLPNQAAQQIRVNEKSRYVHELHSLIQKYNGEINLLQAKFNSLKQSSK